MNSTNDQWLKELYKDTFPQVARIIHRLGGDLDTAKDLFHDAVIIYLEKAAANNLHIQTSAQAYLIGITKILWMKKYKNDNHISFGIDDNFDIPEDFYEPHEKNTESLLSYLKTAGQRCMQLLQAFYYNQLSMQQIAQKFNYKTTRSATVQKYKCLEKVREQIKLSEINEEAFS
ncbi:MAG TPA: sigma-70 family RNA polymerase sigma factor [Flavipsychrobacter sp.]|nr:sigma-70 family RNA polymerase sigma factor [Flavipsychrobacter sp.]